jgi:hypothetical protein
MRNYVCILSDMFRPQFFGHLQREYFLVTQQLWYISGN